MGGSGGEGEPWAASEPAGGFRREDVGEAGRSQGWAMAWTVGWTEALLLMRLGRWRAGAQELQVAGESPPAPGSLLELRHAARHLLVCLQLLGNQARCHTEPPAEVSEVFPTVVTDGC